MIFSLPSLLAMGESAFRTPHWICTLYPRTFVRLCRPFRIPHSAFRTRMILSYPRTFVRCCEYFRI